MKFKRNVRCIKDYVEDGICYWSKDSIYGAIKHRDGNWGIETNTGSIGGVGPAFMLEEFKEHFVEEKR